VHFRNYRFLAIITFLTLIGTYIFFNLGNWLLLSSPLPNNLDVIVTFAEEPERIRYSRLLFDKFPGVYWIISYRDSNIVKEYLPSGLEMSRIFMVDTCKHTQTEILFVKKWLEKNSTLYEKRNLPCVGFVSSPFHQLRIRWLSIMAGLNASSHLLSLPAPMSWYWWPNDFFKCWWKTKLSRKIVLSEYLKMLFN
jgi:hypothetical protein